jgi:glycerol uptake facilitator-like aquaporin
MRLVRHPEYRIPSHQAELVALGKEPRPAPVAGVGVGTGRGILVEAILTFLLVFVRLASADHDDRARLYQPLGIELVYQPAQRLVAASAEPGRCTEGVGGGT